MSKLSSSYITREIKTHRETRIEREKETVQDGYKFRRDKVTFLPNASG